MNYRTVAARGNHWRQIYLSTFQKLGRAQILEVFIADCQNQAQLLSLRLS